jgi:crossover junction endodeoxyribonuclease RusA
MIDLPYPPSVNTYWRANGKRRFISKAGVLFSKEVQFLWKLEKHSGFKDHKIKMDIIIHPRSKRIFDLDNCLKAILDALMKAGAYDDDSQIDELTIKRGVFIKGGLARVTMKVCY